MHEISIFDKSLAGQAWLDMPEPVHERMRAESIALHERARRWAAFGRVPDRCPGPARLPLSGLPGRLRSAYFGVVAATVTR